MYNVNKNNEELKNYQNTKYYGQWETDKIIESYFDISVKGKCIEIGAANGIKGSNTKYFEDNGWDVLCIEANPNQEESLKKCRKHVRMYGCGSDNFTTKLTVFNVGINNIESSLTSIYPDERLVEDHKHIINNINKISIEVKTLNWILENDISNTPLNNHDHFNFISIDTEGTELDVLKGLNLYKYNIDLLVVENNYYDRSIVDYLKNHGYKLDQRYKINDFYIKDTI
jgi:FkbM family methyltransferase